MTFPTYGKIKAMFRTTNQCMCVYYVWYACIFWVIIPNMFKTNFQPPTSSKLGSLPHQLELGDWLVRHLLSSTRTGTDWENHNGWSILELTKSGWFCTKDTGETWVNSVCQILKAYFSDRVLGRPYDYQAIRASDPKSHALLFKKPLLKPLNADVSPIFSAWYGAGG